MAPTCAPSQAQVIVEIMTDNFPGDTSWTVIQDDVVVKSSREYALQNWYRSTVFSFHRRPVRTAAFTIVDSFLDGFCCGQGVCGCFYGCFFGKRGSGRNMVLRYWIRERKGSVFTVKFRGMLDTVRLRIVSLAVRGTGTAWLLRPAFSAPPIARRSDGRTPSVVRTAGCRRREPKRDIFGWENRRRILKLYSIQLWQPA